jgi:cupin 2 domain-containing protein
MNDIQNIFSSIPDDFPQELLQDILITDGFKIDIPAHLKHRVQWTDPNIETVWIAIMY